MATWGAGSFENDDAADFESEVIAGEIDDLTLVFEQVEEMEVVDTSTAAVALATAEVIAALRGHPSKALSEDLSEWVHDQRGGMVEADTALRVVEKIRSGSDLKDHWDDASEEDKKAWYASVDDLIARLKARV